jgi:hypothetical protein
LFLAILELDTEQRYLCHLLERGSCLMLMTPAQTILVLAKSIKRIIMNWREGILTLNEQLNSFTATDSVQHYVHKLALIVQTT